MRSRNRAHSSEVELDITAFLNLMVVLIPFLLLNAVFAQVSVLQLNLPSSDDSTNPPPEDEDKPPFVLEVLIYKNRYEVVDRQTGPLKIIPNSEETGEHDTVELDAFLVRLKERGPEITSATILCEDDTPYALLIKTMDAVRLTTTDINGEDIKKELFPDIGIGVAPPDRTAAEGEAAATGGAS